MQSTCIHPIVFELCIRKKTKVEQNLFTHSMFLTLRKVRELWRSKDYIRIAKGFLSISVSHHCVMVILELLLCLMYRTPF